MVLLSYIATVAAFAVTALAHTHHPTHKGITDLHRRSFKDSARRSLDACSDQLQRRGVFERAEKRRAELAARYGKRTLKARDTEDVLNTDHHSNLTNVGPDTSAEDLFTDSPVCILSPEGEIGPFWVKGELIRQDVRDDQEGVPVYLDGQFIDIDTCEPIEGLYWDVWNCNTTGVYSGVVDRSNGDGDDTSNLDATFLRGLQPTDSDGVAQFHTIFPGHYGGRTTHVHVVAHVGATVLPNNTLTGGHAAHIGQLFFDQDLIDAVEETAPYNTNQVRLTTNAEDRVFGTETTGTTSDPVFNYAYLGDSLSDGILAWITMGVNVSASYDTRYAAFYGEDGGIPA
ncbi:Intradiol ring-cleavage dioxygenase [Aspergillus avenaceus]|uniref:Intradiol ring-cleavage dioxygenase n=1 Tax=Aspergillus avenaceus TaxID=36643 RepID=A0A5N6TZC6_ASPAV|nr:Intradiol ring-cleavage dioxygenase [Aspergillus avenaceus]